MLNSLGRMTILASATFMLLAFAVACGGTAVQPQAQEPGAPQQPAAAEQPGAPAAAAAAKQPAAPAAAAAAKQPKAAEQPAAPQKPERPAPSVGGFATGAQTSPKAKPTAVAAPKDTIKRGGIIRQSHRRSPLHFRLDVRSATDETTANSPLFNQLLALQHPGFVSVGPDLATSWEVSEDGKTFTFKLVPNVVNHKGNPWTSRDAKFTLETLAKETENRPPHASVSVGGVSTLESIETPDDTTLIVNLNQADGLFLANMSLQQPVMYTEADYDEVDSLDNPVGTGPFFLANRRVGEKLEYRRHEQYFKEDLPYLDGIDIFIIRDVAAKLAALEAQRLDLIMMGSSHGLHPDNLQPVADRHPGELIFYAAQHPVGRGIKFNWREEGPWQDTRVRQAINLAIDRDKICGALPNCILGDYMPSTTYGFTKREELAARPGFAMPGPAKDAELTQAKQLMADAGFPDGFTVKALCRDTSEYRDHFCPVAEFILRDTLNIRMELDVQESGAWVEKHNTGDWLFEAGSAGSARVDHPFDWLDYQSFCGEPPVNNTIGYCNEQLDELLREMRVNSDVEKLKVLSKEAINLLYEDLPYVQVFWPARYPVAWSYVKNLADERFSGQYSQARRLEQVWLDK